MNINGSVALVTGANRGIGRAFVDELLKRGAKKVYVAARDPASLSDLVQSAGGRLVPLTLDVTNAAHIAAAVAAAPDVTLLINNAGAAAFEGAISAADLSPARQEMEVNYFGPLALTRSFAPVLASSGGGAMLNMLSMLALVSLPMAATYSASKAAMLSLTRSIRAELAAQGTLVVGVLAVQTETPLGARLPEPRLKPEDVVSDALDAIEAGTNDDIAAGSLSRGAYQAITADPKAFQAKMSTRLPQKK
jgi:NAD(P)-dependent dehydrogenase (short-subunit alcohol dehydrogenase family)